MVRYILLAALAAGGLGAEAQKVKPELELHMEARSVQNGLPRQFRFMLRNMSDHDIRLPEPPLGCADNRGSGSVWLLVNLAPSKPGVPLNGPNCIADSLGRHEGILAQAKSWIVLRPGGYLERSADAGKMHLQDQGAGSYELSAAYVPPQLSGDEQRILAAAGIEYPHVRLVSEKVVFRK